MHEYYAECQVGFWQDKTTLTHSWPARFPMAECVPPAMQGKMHSKQGPD